MSPTGTKADSQGVRRRVRAGGLLADDVYLAYLESNSLQAEVQGIIRDGIRRGLIRVLPAADASGRVRIRRI